MEWIEPHTARVVAQAPAVPRQTLDSSFGLQLKPVFVPHNEEPFLSDRGNLGRAKAKYCPLTVPSFGESAAIAAIPQNMAALSVTADNMHVVIALSFPPIVFDFFQNGQRSWVAGNRLVAADRRINAFGQTSR